MPNSDVGAEAPILNAFTCTGPYAMLILAGVKFVENRKGMPTPTEGRCAISVSKSFSCKEYVNFIEWANKCFGFPWCTMNLWDWKEVRDWRGCIVGVADYKAVSSIPEDELYSKQCRFWNEGYPNWWLFSNIKRLPTPIPCRGNVGMWQLDDALSAAVSSAAYLPDNSILQGSLSDH